MTSVKTLYVRIIFLQHYNSIKKHNHLKASPFEYGDYQYSIISSQFFVLVSEKNSLFRNVSAKKVM